MYRIIFFAGIMTLFACCESANTNQRPPTQYEEKKTSLQEMERESPLKFLKISGSHHTNLFNQTVVTGEIDNKATLVSYKNINVRIIWHDKDGGIMEKESHLLDDVVKPGSSLDFKIKTGHVKGSYSVSFDITGAAPDK